MACGLAEVPICAHPAMSLKIAVIASPGFSTDCALLKRCPSRGYGVDMARVLCQHVNLNCSFVWHTDEFGTVLPNGTATGVFAGVERGDYDAAMPSFAPTYQRFHALDFSHAFAYPRVVLVTRAPTMQIGQLNWNVIYVFQWPVLLSFFLALLVTAIFITTINRSSFIKNFFALLVFDRKVATPLSDSARLVIAAWTLATVVLCSIYGNVLFSQKVSLTSSFPFTDLETFVDCLKSKLCRLVTQSLTLAYYADLVQGGSRLSHSLRQALRENPVIVSPLFDKTFFDNILDERRHYLVVLTLKDHALIETKGNRDCDFYMVDIRYTSTGYTFPVRKGFPLLHVLNKAVLHYQQSGINSLVLSKYTRVTRDGHCYGQYGSRSWLEEGHGLYSVRTVFLIYCSGIVAAVLVLFVEFAWRSAVVRA